MKVLIIDNFDSFTYNLAQLIEQSGDCQLTIVKNDKQKIDAGSYDKIVFSPGPGIPSEEAGMMKYILQHYAGIKPILGVCLGHQAIAEYYGATLINLPEVYHGIKESIHIVDSSEMLFKGIPAYFNGGLYHSWGVSKENFPDVLTITAVAESGVIMALSHRALNVRSVQFHPESIMTEAGVQIMANWLCH